MVQLIAGNKGKGKTKHLLDKVSTEELLQVSGVGEVKAARYGEAFLAAIRDWQAAQQTQTEAAEPPEPEP